MLVLVTVIEYDLSCTFKERDYSQLIVRAIHKAHTH